MAQYNYLVDKSDPKYPALARSGPEGIESYRPKSPGKWERSAYLNHLSPEEFYLDYDYCTEEEAKKYAAMIEKNVAAMSK